MLTTINARKLTLALADAAVVAAIAAVLGLGFPAHAFAYVDPSVMTYTIQALAGVAVALSTVIGVVWRRARRKVYKTFNIDENRGKLVEPSVERLDSAQAKEASERCYDPSSFASQARRDPDLKHKPDRWWKRVLPAALVSTFATGTLLVVAPYEIVASNSASLLFGLDDIWAPVALSALAVDVALICMLSLLRGRAFRLACALLVAFGLCCWAQALFMNFALPAADGSVPRWGEYTTITVESALLWVAIFALVIVFSLRGSWKMQRVLPFVAAAMIAVQGAGVASLFLDAGNNASAEENSAQAISAKPPVITKEGMFDLAPKDNVVVFVLDTTDTTDTIPLVEEHPESFKEFTDFTFFTDVSGAMVPTRYGTGFLYTAQLPRHGEDFMDYYRERYDRSEFMKDIADLNYSVGIYTDSFLNGTQYMSDYVDNLHTLEENPKIAAPEAIVSALWKCAMYRDMTWALKPAFWFYTDEINDAITYVEEDWGSNSPYIMNDPRFYEELTNRKLRVVDNGFKGDFRILHLLGSHVPYVMDENAKAVAIDDSNLERQTLGAIKIVSEYIRQMKELGVYDNSTVIVTADHGKFDYGPDKNAIDRPTSPIMFVKPANPKNPGQPMAVSNIPITHGHFHPTVIEAMGGNFSKYGTPALSETENNDLRYYLMTVHDGKVDTALREYVIDGDVTDFKNWSLTGEEWDFYMDGTLLNNP